MPAALIALAILGGALEREPDATFAFDRIDLISEDPGTWLNYDVHYFSVFPTSTTVRWVSQVKAVWRTPYRGLHIGASLRSQSMVLEVPLATTEKHGFYLTGGAQTRLLLPTGLLGGLAWRYGPVRIGTGISAVSTASWSHRSWTHWQVLPTLGLGIGRHHAPSTQ